MSDHLLKKVEHFVSKSLVFLLKATIEPETLLSNKLKSIPISYRAAFSQVSIALPNDDGETAPLSS